MNDDFKLRLQISIEQHLKRIERIVGKNYKLTLVARYAVDDGKDADIVMTLDDFDKALATINKMKGRTE